MTGFSATAVAASKKFLIPKQCPFLPNIENSLEAIRLNWPAAIAGVLVRFSHVAMAASRCFRKIRPDRAPQVN
jgi:hypothetical protein